MATPTIVLTHTLPPGACSRTLSPETCPTLTPPILPRRWVGRQEETGGGRLQSANYRMQGPNSLPAGVLLEFRAPPACENRGSGPWQCVLETAAIPGADKGATGKR